MSGPPGQAPRPPGRVKRWLRIEHLTWRELGRRFVKELEEDAVADSAAQLSYYYLFALFPFLFFLVTLAAYLPLGPGAVEDLLVRVEDLMPGAALALVREHLTSLVTQERPNLLTGGVLVTLWSASRGVDALRKALNLAYDVPESRPYWKTQVLAMVMTVAGTLLIPLAFGAFFLGGRVGAWVAGKLALTDLFHLVWSWLRWPFTASLVMLTASLSYYLLPDVRQRFKYITPGSLFATAGWLVATWGFTRYVEAFGTYNATYGSIAGVMVLLLWLYITGLVFIVGGEMNAVLEHASTEGKAKGAREEGQPSPAEPPVKTPGAAKTAATAQRSQLAFWRWRRRAARGLPPEPAPGEDAPDDGRHP